MFFYVGITIINIWVKYMNQLEQLLHQINSVIVITCNSEKSSDTKQER